MADEQKARGVDPELLADLRNCNRGQTADLIEQLYEALVAFESAHDAWLEADYDTNAERHACASMMRANDKTHAALAKARGQA